MISIFPSEPMAPAKGPSDRAAKAPPESKDGSEQPTFAKLVNGESDTKSETPPAEQDKNPADQPLLSASLETIEPQTPKPDALTPNAAKPTEAEINLTAEQLAKAEAGSATDAADPKLMTASADPELSADVKPQSTDMIADSESVAPVKADSNGKTDADKFVEVRPAQTDAEKTTVEGDIAKANPDTQRAEPVAGAAEESLRAARTGDAADTPRVDTAEIQSRTGSDTSSTTDKAFTAVEKTAATLVTRDAPVSSSEALFTAVQSQSSQSTVATPGLTPTAPTAVIAAPNDVTGIILNALKNGVEPQEQLIVQLDPPELGRVLIDFKFDAQGVQQITVTTENPEALKRLRELHFELTEALKDHGLSDKNMSFQQQAEERPQPNWQMPELMGAAVGPMVETQLAATPALVRTNNAQLANDRLDLTL